MFNKIKSFFRRKFFKRKSLENYRFVREIGYGSSAYIYQTQYKINNKYYTCKRFPKNKKNAASRELYILRLVNHSYFPKYHNFQIDNRYLYLFFDYIPGNDLFDVFKKQMKGNIGGENNLKKFVRQMIYCLRACEFYNIQHLDIKLENFIVTDLEPPRLKLIDFGHAHYIFDDRRLSLYNTVGTRGYLPPETEENEFHKTSDIWSLGVCVWILVTCKSPFYYNQEEDYHDFTFPTEEHTELMEEMSPLLCDFFSSIFRIQPEERITMAQLIRHRWLD